MSKGDKLLLEDFVSYILDNSTYFSAERQYLFMLLRDYLKESV